MDMTNKEYFKGYKDGMLAEQDRIQKSLTYMASHFYSIGEEDKAKHFVEALDLIKNPEKYYNV